MARPVRDVAPASTAPAAAEDTGPYATLPGDEVLARLETSWRGLTTDEAARRLARHGANLIAGERGEPLWRRFAANLTNVFALLLWVAASLSWLIGATESALAIVAVILVNAAFSFGQEYRAERALAALRRLLPLEATVRRDGDVRTIPAAGVVPGDLLILEEGAQIPADARVLRANDLRVDSAALTGESTPVRKTAEAVPRGGAPWLQLPDLVFAGTSVAAGSAEAVAFATGMRTAFGRIAHLTQSVGAGPSPLQRQVGRIARTVTLLSVGLGGVFFALGHTFAHLSWRAGAVFAIGLVLANVPEGLLPTLSLALASGAQRLAARHALVKRLSAVETLGAATVICTDKTGTLTENEMTVREVWVAGRRLEVTGVGYAPQGAFFDARTAVTAETLPALAWLARAAALCNTAQLLPPDDAHPAWRVHGDPTEGALLVAAAKAGLDARREARRWPCVRQVPFDSHRKRMSVVHEVREASPGLAAGAHLVFTKGAPQEVLARCAGMLTCAGVGPLGDGERAAVLAEIDRCARQGLRVLAAAYRALPAAPVDARPEALERGLTFIGLLALHDPPRPEVAAAVARARQAGIRVVMLTGDYGLTAEAIARQIGLVRAAAPRIATGADLDGMTDAALGRLLAAPGEVLFARVTPEHKLRIVEGFRALGEVVAVTGDGVNDAPALKRADIGVAMGRIGTDVAREAAALVLTDDDFASIVAAIEGGRAVYDNIRKFITYIFAHLAGEAIPFVLFALFQLPLPLTVLQILAIDLGTETLPALALGVEPPEPDVMQRPPRSPREHLLNGPTLLRGYGYLGLLLSAATLCGYFWQLTRRGWHWGVTATDPRFAVGTLYQREAATTVFLGIVLMQVANVFACRTERASVFWIGFWRNRLVFAGIAFELAFAAVLIYLPWCQRLVGTAPLGPENWLLLAGFAPLVLLAEEGRKALVRRREMRPRRAQGSGPGAP